MRRSVRFSASLLLGLALVTMLCPADVQAEHRRVLFRPLFHPGAFYSPFYWGAYGWYPHWGPFPPYGYYVGGYRHLSSVRVQATPREAQVYVDGYFVGWVDDFDGWSQRLRLEPGEYEIQLYLEGFRPVSEKILLRPDSTFKLRRAMEKLGAGEPAPPRPQPSATSNDLRSSRRPYGGETEERRGRRSDNRAPDAADLGTLAVRVQPAGARVEIDGERWDGADGGERLEVRLPLGKHRVVITKDGYRSYAADVEVKPGDVTTLNVSLPSD